MGRRHFTNQHANPVRSRGSGLRRGAARPAGHGIPGALLPPHRSLYKKPVLREDPSWKKLAELKVKITAAKHELPHDINTRDIFDLLRHHGNIVKIEVLKADPTKPRAAIVMFNPPPAQPFWETPEIGTVAGVSVRAEYLPPQPMDNSLTTSRRYEDVGSCPVSRLDFGFMYQQDHAVLMRSVFAQGPNDVRLNVNRERRELTVFFGVDEDFLRNKHSGTYSMPPDTGSMSSVGPSSMPQYEFKFQISFQLLRQMTLLEPDQDSIGIVLSQPKTSPPLFYMKAQPRSTMEGCETYWTQHRAWFRITNICDNDFGKTLLSMPLGLREPESFVTIGSWTTFRLCIPREAFFSEQFQHVRQILSDQSLDFHPNDRLRVSSFRERPEANHARFWDFLEPAPNLSANNAMLLSSLAVGVRLEWPVRYQLEVCIAKDLLNPSNIYKDFVTQLADLSEKRAINLLEFVADKGERFFIPMDIFKLRPPRSKIRKGVPANHVLQRSITVKPSSIEPNTPAIEESNRILRRYSSYSDRFIRVMFRDEKSEGKIFSSDDEVNDALFNRVRRCLRYGIQIGDRHFEWLASGNSQFREHGAYFFNSVPGLTAQDIRNQMGNYSREHEVAKAASRMGQCFSTTRDYDGPVEPMELQDEVTVGPNGRQFTFTDGVGQISPFLATIINQRMKLPPYTSAYQFRYGGCKGVLAKWPDAQRFQIRLRPSQTKFDAAERGRLEIIRGARFVRAELNRQLITILSCLEVHDDIFMNKVEEQLAEIQTAVHLSSKAEELLRKRTDVNMVTSTIADMVKDGFLQHKEPFVQTLLHLWQAWSHKQLKEKASIQVDSAAFVIGITDETKSLKGHKGGRTLPEIFLQISDPLASNTIRVVEGVCILARNPSLHPGDIRVVRAVDNPRLRHLTNVVVFSQTGTQDVPSMCSGGDLDGDDYFVSWDRTLIPPEEEWNQDPLVSEKLDRPTKVPNVSDDQIKDFFVRHMKQDSLGKIAHAWLAQADQLGAKHPSCKALADLHSTAVDFPKTGIAAKGETLRRLRPRKYPHFLESNRPAHKVYFSHSVVGKLYDAVQTIKFHPILNDSFDDRILSKYQPDPDRDRTVKALKAEYDSELKRIMSLYEIQTECEIWSAFILKLGKAIKEYEVQSKVGNLLGAIKEKFREACIAAAGGREMSVLGPFLVAMYHETAEEVSSTLKRVQHTYDFDSPSTPQLQPQEMPMISFPWMFAHELGQLAKTKHTALPRADAGIDSGYEGLSSPSWTGSPMITNTNNADDRFGEGVIQTTNESSVYCEDNVPDVGSISRELEGLVLIPGEQSDKVDQCQTEISRGEYNTTEVEDEIEDEEEEEEDENDPPENPFARLSKLVEES